MFYLCVIKIASRYSPQNPRACHYPSQRFGMKESNQIDVWLDLMYLGWGSELIDVHSTKAFEIILTFSLLEM